MKYMCGENIRVVRDGSQYECIITEGIRNRLGQIAACQII